MLFCLKRIYSKSWLYFNKIVPMNLLKQRYLELDKLRYSEENIAELFSILNKIITFLQEKDSDRITNKSLHFVLLTKEREFKRFYYEELKSIPEKVFES